MLVEDFVGFFPAEAFAGLVVYFVDDFLEFGFADLFEVGAFGEVSA